MPKCFNWPMPLKDIRYIIKKANVILLPILPLNKATILKTINILRFLNERRSLESVIEDKIVPIKRDFLTIRNVTWALYCKQDEPNTLYKFSWLELIAELFYLQMNLLRLFHMIFWGKSRDQYLLQWFHIVLAQKRVSMKIKNFHIYNDFFKTIIQAHIIGFCMHH